MPRNHAGVLLPTYPQRVYDTPHQRAVCGLALHTRHTRTPGTPADIADFPVRLAVPHPHRPRCVLPAELAVREAVCELPDGQIGKLKVLLA